MPKEFWEFLLVDNASAEPLERAWDLSWHPNARCVREEELGLTPARLRGVRESRGALLIYVDDDSVLIPDYIAKSWSISQAYNWLGVIGAGVMRPEFESPPAPKLERKLHFLALRTRLTAAWSNNPDDAAAIPYGAGLGVRREVANRYIDLLDKMGNRECIDRRGEALTCGGDDLFSYAAVMGGLGFGVFPELELTHLIGENRTGEAYLLRLVESHEFSHVIIRHLLGQEPMHSMEHLARIRRILSATKRGLFETRAELAVQRGSQRAQQYIRERKLIPISI